jgi:hypothetical protein
MDGEQGFNQFVFYNLIFIGVFFPVRWLISKQKKQIAGYLISWRVGTAVYQKFSIIGLIPHWVTLF